MLELVSNLRFFFSLRHNIWYSNNWTPLVVVGFLYDAVGNMKVDKDQFDALLHKMMQTPPAPTKTIKSEKASATIIPPPKPVSPKQ